MLYVLFILLFKYNVKLPKIKKPWRTLYTCARAYYHLLLVFCYDLVGDRFQLHFHRLPQGAGDAPVVLAHTAGKICKSPGQVFVAWVGQNPVLRPSHVEHMLHKHLDENGLALNVGQTVISDRSQKPFPIPIPAGEGNHEAKAVQECAHRVLVGLASLVVGKIRLGWDQEGA